MPIYNVCDHRLTRTICINKNLCIKMSLYYTVYGNDTKVVTYMYAQY